MNVVVALCRSLLITVTITEPSTVEGGTRPLILGLPSPSVSTVVPATTTLPNLTVSGEMKLVPMIAKKSPPLARPVFGVIEVMVGAGP